ncbi:MAG: hypothetical protein LBF92_07580, partial [Synergistaceae bacterium]|nr:hypothetical protein [Synergistaceae bacterium]
MTYELLVKIVVEVIKRLEALQKLRVGGFAFDAGNEARVRAKAESINGAFELLSYGDLEGLTPCDILFMDRLPIEHVPNLALGVSCDALDRYLNRLISGGGRVFLLEGVESQAEKAPRAFRDMMSSYARTLASFGYIFPREASQVPTRVAGPSGDATVPGQRGQVFTGKFLT